ncbi:MAG: DUF4197 family protein [Sphingomonadaceae bacterium]
MTVSGYFNIGRRAFIAGVTATGAMAVAGCMGVKTVVFSAVIRRLMVKSSDRAIETMLAPGGYWDQVVANSDVASFMGPAQPLAKQMLVAPGTKERMDEAFGNIARSAAKVVAPVIGDVVAHVGIKNAREIAEGGPTAAADYLRANTDGALARAMNSEILRAIRESDTPVMQQLKERMQNVDMTQVGMAAARRLEGLIWDQVGIEEAAIRADPSSTNDPELIEVLEKIRQQRGNNG